MTIQPFLRLVAFGLVVGLVSQGAAEDRRLFGGRRQKDEIPISAFTGLEKITAKLGGDATEKIVEMRGREGQSQPLSWDLVVYDRKSPLLVREFTVANDSSLENEAVAHYPERVPTGFIDKQQLLIDSTAAFRILEHEAHNAGVGFDRVHYLLRCREFAEEPLWRLTAQNVEGYVVGRVDLSGATGTVLRTIWYSWDQRGRGMPMVVDSAAPEDFAVPPALPFSPGDYSGTAIPPALPPTAMTPPAAGLEPAPGLPVVEVSPAEPLPQNPGSAAGVPGSAGLQPPANPRMGTPPPFAGPAVAAPAGRVVVESLDGDPVRVEPIPVEPDLQPKVEVEPVSPAIPR